MSKKYPGGFITKNPTTPTSSAAPGVWTLEQALEYIKAGTWPLPPVPYYLYVWGSNTYGQYGDGTIGGQFSGAPVEVVPSAETFSDPDAAIGTDAFTLNIKANGTLWAWGNNANGCIGDGTVVSKSSPVQIGSLKTWRKVAAGEASLAIKSDGTLWAWGRNDRGQLGDGTVVNKSSPIQIGADSNWLMVSGKGSFVAAIKTDGTLWSWGDGGFGRTGQNDTVSLSSPTQIGALSDWSYVSAGVQGTLAIKTDGTLWGWGRNIYGLLGNGAEQSVSSPVQIGALGNWAKVSQGGAISAAIKTDGTLWTWGYNSTGELGDGTVISKSSPIQVGALTTWNDVNATSQVISATKTDGTLWGWGNNANQAVGNYSSTDYSSPVQVGAAKKTWSKLAKSGANTQMILTKSGMLYGVGNNSNGQLGTNSVSTVNHPVIINTSGEWSEFSGTHDNQSGAVVAKWDGTLWAWGYNAYGPLGDNTIISRSSPVQIGSDTDWISSSYSGWTSVAINRKTDLFAWGLNNEGQLGQNDIVNRSSPVQIAGTWQMATANYYSIAAIRTDNTLWAWGYNVYGQLGIGNVDSKSSPVQVGVRSDWMYVTGSLYSTYGIIENNATLYAWGNNGAGQLGVGNTTNEYTPQSVTTGVASVAACIESMMFVKSDGTLWATGGNAYGQLGRNNTTSVSTPAQVGSDTDWAAVAACENAFIILKNNGTLWFVGQADSFGASGTFTITSNQSSPVQVGSATDWAYITGKTRGAFALTNNGEIYGWGRSTYGDLANNTIYFNYYLSPYKVGSSAVWKSIGMGAQTRLGIKLNGTLWAWGSNGFGVYGNNTTEAVTGTKSLSPIQIGSDANWSQVYINCATSANEQSALAIKTDGTLWSWGCNEAYGQLGQGDVINRSSPVQVGSDTNWALVAPSGYRTVRAIKTDGTLWGWGRNTVGTIGDGTANDRSSPVQVGALTNWLSVNGFYYTTVAVKTDGTLWAWGNNGGRLGNNSTTTEYSPIQIGALTTWAKAAIGEDSGLAVKTDGTLWVWGQNQYGSLGNNSTTANSSPVQLGAGTDWADVFGMEQSSFAIKTDGTLWAWGKNTSGQLGDGTLINRSSPVQVGSINTWKFNNGASWPGTMGGLATT